MRAESLGLAGKTRVSMDLTTQMNVTGNAKADGFNGINSTEEMTYQVEFNVNENEYQMLDDSGTVVGTSNNGMNWVSADGDDTFSTTNRVDHGMSITINHNSTTSSVAGYTALVYQQGLEPGDYTFDYVSATEVTLLDSQGRLPLIKEPLKMRTGRLISILPLQ
jgi:hypothetical protein